MNMPREVSYQNARTLAVALTCVALIPCLWSLAMVVHNTISHKMVPQWVVLVSGISTAVLVVAVVGVARLKPVCPKQLDT